MTRADAMADWPTNGELIEEQLRVDQDFRAEWERTSVGRGVAITLVRHRAAHGISQRDLAEHLGVSPGTVARLETGETNPRTDEVRWLSGQLGLDPHMDVEPLT
jgi:ribosome-binding protein aMBF1 (putative translation factor)